MGVENVCTSIALDLGLGCHHGRLHETPLKEKPSFKFDDLFFTSSSTSVELPSLTLGLSEINKGCEEISHNNSDNTQPHTPLSSFSNTSIKRERDYGSGGVSEEMGLERVSSRISDEDDEGINGRKKLRLTKEQSALLEESFKEHTTLNPKQKQALARELSLRPRQVEVWFQNRRARTKLKQTEVDCEVLRKCCQTLTDENRRLHKELQELKALKLTSPLYMQLPAATLSMCPSCEKIGGGVVGGGGGGGGGEGASKPTTQFTMATKSHFFNPFTHPSAAC
ncbi:homeobox-leucine zipper protein [Ranunculus cassubicifolius]